MLPVTISLCQLLRYWRWYSWSLTWNYLQYLAFLKLGDNAKSLRHGITGSLVYWGTKSRSIMYHVSCIMYSLFCFLYHVSCILYPIFCILYPASCILYPISRNPYPISCILYHVYAMLCGPTSSSWEGLRTSAKSFFGPVGQIHLRPFLVFSNNLNIF